MGVYGPAEWRTGLNPIFVCMDCYWWLQNTQRVDANVTGIHDNGESPLHILLSLVVWLMLLTEHATSECECDRHTWQWRIPTTHPSFDTFNVSGVFLVHGTVPHPRPCYRHRLPLLHHASLTGHKINLFKRPFWGSSFERLDDVFVLLIFLYPQKILISVKLPFEL